MSLTALGYIGIRSARSADWSGFATGLLGMQKVDGTRGSSAFRMDDRRQRLLHATPEGTRLARTLAAIQARRIEHAVAGLDISQREAAAQFLARLINDTERNHVLKIVRRS